MPKGRYNAITLYLSASTAPFVTLDWFLVRFKAQRNATALPASIYRPLQAPFISKGIFCSVRKKASRAFIRAVCSVCSVFAGTESKENAHTPVES